VSLPARALILSALGVPTSLSWCRVPVIVAAISPYRAAREQARALMGERFVEAYVEASVETCAERDPKGLYAKARAGELPGFTGIDDPYEVPERPDLELRAGEAEPVAALLALLAA